MGFNKTHIKMDKQENLIRVGLCGPSGSGKTTMAKYISCELGIPFINSSAFANISKERLQYWEAIIGCPVNLNHEFIIRKSHLFPDFGFDFQKTVLDIRRGLLESIPGSFVMDRTPIDIAVYTALQCGPYMTHDTLIDFYDDCKQLTNTRFTHLINISNALQPCIEDDGVRVNNLQYQKLVVNPVFQEHFNQFSNRAEIVTTKIFTWDLNQRKKLVSEFLENTI